MSTAIPEDNPELAAARQAGARVLHRGELLGEVSRLKRAIAIAGTHGKTTTCGMAAHALVATGRDPAFLIGGELRSEGTNAAWGQGEWIVVEADESDRSFLELSRDVAVVTNVELDHHHTYRSLSELEEAFADFAAAGGGSDRRSGGGAGRRAELRDRIGRPAGRGRGARPAELALRGGGGGGGAARCPARTTC